MKKIITWAKPTWEMPHIGNLVWAILPLQKLAENNDAALFIADLHALTSVKDAKLLKEYSKEVALTYFSIFGIDTKVKIFRQSDIISIPKLNWILSNVTPYSLMLRAHSFKDSQAKKIDLNMWVFNYPILMAADIIWYDIDIVPVWEDQKQHLEMTRDIAKAFNKAYKTEIFKLPVEYIEKSVGLLPGLDWRKMSKSYNNFIWIFDDEKTLKKKIMSIVTDSKWVDEPKDPETCNIFALIKVFWEKNKIEEIRLKYLSWWYGYWHAKQELFEILNPYIGNFRAKREELSKNYDLIEKKLAEWAKVMNERIEEKMKEVKNVVGL
ncbi:MAG: hypothetical protein ACD_4C00457G0001 [uncultured bacterium (gcode 4)]|uniref:Tryptophan--tRNA ligase n=1 Tax=uncultured bacterium (gcode 4) TaxID=1234023 RepID=K2GRW8_9BACT|nr:MAG: hypothetical protein ACD_4C00457G0001 [uncultured bacterium (gcode 4)]